MFTLFKLYNYFNFRHHPEAKDEVYIDYPEILKAFSSYIICIRTGKHLHVLLTSSRLRKIKVFFILMIYFYQLELI